MRRGGEEESGEIDTRCWRSGHLFWFHGRWTFTYEEKVTLSCSTGFFYKGLSYPNAAHSREK